MAEIDLDGEAVFRKLQDDFNQTFAAIKARFAALEARAAAIETRLADLERRMHISPELMRRLEEG